MARVFKFAGIALGTLLLLAILYLWFADLSAFKPRVEAAVSEATGREFRIDGDFRIDVLPSPTVVVENASLANAAWAEEPSMLQIGHFSSNVGLWSLLFRPVDVKDLQLSDVTVYVETNADGESNWEFPPDDDVEAADEQDDGPAEAPAKLQHADIKNVKVVYRHPEAEEQVFLLETFTVVADDSGSQNFSAKAQLNDLPITLDGTAADRLLKVAANVGEVRFESTSQYDGENVDLDITVGTLDQVGNLLEVENLPAEDLSLKGDVSLDGKAIRLSGVVAEMGSLKVALDGTIDGEAAKVDMSVNASGANLDVLRPDLPTIPFSVGTDLVFVEESIRLDPLELKFGDSVVTGMLSAELKEIPVIKLEAQSPLVDLAPFLPAEDEGGEDNAKDTEEEAESGGLVFKDEPLPLDVLQKAVADVDVTIDRLKTANTEFSDFVLKLMLKDGELDIDNALVGELGGSFKNKILMTFTESQADVDASIHADDMKLVALAGSKIEPGQVPTSSLDIDLKATGGTPHALASSADGKILFMQGPGRVDNTLISKFSGDIIAQLFSALNPFAKDEEFSNWECSLLGVDFNSGQGEIDTFLLQGEKIMVVGGGQIDMSTEKLNVEFNTKPRKGVGISADMFVTPFVAMTGTLAEPSIGLNAKGALLSGGAAFLTGGLSFLYQGLADRATAEAGKCEETFDAVGESMPGSP